MLTARTVISNFEEVTKRVENAAVRSGREPREIELLIVTKYANPQDILTLLKAKKLLNVGESRVQDATARWSLPYFSDYKNDIKKHFIGHLQSNKIKKAVEFFDFIDCVDNVETAHLIDKRADEVNKKVQVMVQVKLTDKQTQSGIEPNKASILVNEIRKMKNICVRGYMAIAPTAENPKELRPIFKKAKQLFDSDFADVKGEKSYLSLGMSSDFEIAVEEGSNLPRIGSMIFDVRK